MATVERTAYPRFPKVFSTGELQARYTPDIEELEWGRRNARGQSSRLGLLVLLKVFQEMHHFPNLDSIPAAVIDHVRACADIGAEVEFGYDRARSVALFRHYAAIREYLGIQSYYGTDANEGAVRAAREAAETMDQSVDIINATIDSLIQQQVELPAFSTLDAIAEQVHARTQTALFRRVARRLTDDDKAQLDRLLKREFSQRQTAYNTIKRYALRPSRKHISLPQVSGADRQSRALARELRRGAGLQRQELPSVAVAAFQGASIGAVTPGASPGMGIDHAIPNLADGIGRGVRERVAAPGMDCRRR